MIAVSIVSHGNGNMVAGLAEEVLACPEVGQVLITLNIPESIKLPEDARLLIVRNAAPVGFAANHNAAFQHCLQPYFCVVNPDIQLQGNPFPNLLEAINEFGASIVAPLIISPQGSVEDSMRRFPTIISLWLKACGVSDGSYLSAKDKLNFFAEWIAGMFLVFRSCDFKRLQGFDPGFFLYYEDVDICVRAWRAGLKVLACPSVSAIHDAQRTSRRNLRYLRWHVASMARYLAKHWGRLPAVPKRA